jgi:hypothetical protein
MINITAPPSYNPSAKPANTIPVPEGFDPSVPNWMDDLLPVGESPSYPVTINPATSIPPYNERVNLVPTLFLSLPYRRYKYALTPQLHTPSPTPVLLSGTYTSLTGSDDNFFASWSQQVYGWNAYLQPYTWAD